jgi:hypothetical protein
MSINDNKYFLALAVFMLNIGARHIPNQLGNTHSRMIESDMIQRFILFSLFFVSTRDIVIALTLTLLFSFFIFGFLHDGGKYTLAQSNADIEKRFSEYFGNK